LGLWEACESKHTQVAQTQWAATQVASPTTAIRRNLLAPSILRRTTCTPRQRLHVHYHPHTTRRLSRVLWRRLIAPVRRWRHIRRRRTTYIQGPLPSVGMARIRIPRHALVPARGTVASVAGSHRSIAGASRMPHLQQQVISSFHSDSEGEPG
jgi:hypothetical protein